MEILYNLPWNFLIPLLMILGGVLAGLFVVYFPVILDHLYDDMKKENETKVL